MELILALVGGLTAYFNYRNRKADGSLEREREVEKARLATYVQKPLPENATRLQKIAHWLGFEES